MHIMIGPETSLATVSDAARRTGLDVLRAVRFDENCIIVREADDREWRLSQPDMLCLGLIHTDRDSRIAAQIQQWWHEASGTELQDFNLPSDQPAAKDCQILVEWICRRLVPLIALLGGENKILLNQNRQLRRSYDNLQAAFSQVEHFISSNRLQRPILQHEPRQLVKYWRPARNDERLIQALPILSSRLSYLELNFRTSVSPGRGELRVRVKTEPTARVLEEWIVAYPDLFSGWNSFSLASRVDEPEEVVLECVWSELDGAPAIGLSAPHWDVPYAARSDNAEVPAHSIGVRVWSGLPGVRTPRFATAPKQARKMTDKTTVLPAEALIEATQYRFNATVKREYASVRYLRELGRLLVHPHDDVPTIAMLGTSVPEGATRVSADVRSGTEDAPDLEYAMAVLEPDVAPEGIFGSADDAPAIGFSGWHLVKSTDARRLDVLLDQPASAACRILVATRLPAGASESRAWGTWGAIEVGYETRRAALVALRQEAPPARGPRAMPVQPEIATGPITGPTGSDGRLPIGRESLEVIEPGALIPAIGITRMANILISGWHAPEHDGVWGAGGESRLAFRLPTAVTASKLRMQIGLVVAAADEMRPVVTVIRVNDNLSYRAVFTRPEIQNIELEIPETDSSDLIDLLFQCSRPIRPVDIGTGEDERLLGVRLASLSLFEIEAQQQGHSEVSGDRVAMNDDAINSHNRELSHGE